MRRLLKFLHTLGAVGFMGGMAALGVLVVLAPTSVGTAAYPPLIGAMAKIAAWIVGPSMVLTVVAVLLAIAATSAFQNAGWAWAKAATGILILEGGLHVLGPIQEEAKRGVGPLAAGAVGVGPVLTAEANTLWVLLGVSAANIALAIWRPRLPKSAR